LKKYTPIEIKRRAKLKLFLAYYVEWHLKKELAPLLFEDEETENKYQEIVGC
jgi:hypothetical protein